MVTFVNRPCEDTINIKLIVTDLTKVVASINGFDTVNLDTIFENYRNDDSIKHINLLVNYYNNEGELVEFINKYNKNENQLDIVKNNNTNSNNNQNKLDSAFRNISTPKNHKVEIKSDFVCPECGVEDCLVDKNGKKYPCLSCIQIDIGQKIMKNYSKIVDKNNILIEKLCDIFSQKKEEQ